MATLGANVPTLLDVAKRFRPDGKEVMVAEVLNQTNSMLEDMSWVEGTDSDGLHASMRTGLPTPTWRRYNEGVQPTKSTVATVHFTCAQMEARSAVDVDLANKYSDPRTFRASEDAAFIEGMSQEAQRALIYDNETTSPGRITGLQAYYNSLSAESGKNIVDAGGTGSDNTSIYIVCWHPKGVTGVFPKGSNAGLEVRDLGEQLIQDATGLAGASLQAFVTQFKWKLGLAVPDWRQAARICNVDYSNLMTDSSAADLVKLLTRGLNTINSPSMGRLAIYARREVLQALEEQARASVSTGGGIDYTNVEGKILTTWRGIPLRRTDGLAINEARVT